MKLMYRCLANTVMRSVKQHSLIHNYEFIITPRGEHTTISQSTLENGNRTF